MADVLDEAFGDPAERRAYEAFCAEQDRGLEGFQLDKPALVCRWRMAGKHVPLLNRHIRALSQRKVNGKPLSKNLVSWVKQHIEWSLAEGDFPQRDGVLMLVVDANGQAAMSVGDYEPLGDTTAVALKERARAAQSEAAETEVAPEAICSIDGNALYVGGRFNLHPSGTVSLVEQLAKTRGMEVRPIPMLGAVSSESCFLVSDEHGVVPAIDGAPHPFIDLCAEGYERLRDKAR